MTISDLALAAKKVIDSAWLNEPTCDLSSTAAFALESAQMIQSPETVAEMDVLRRSVESNRVDGQRLIRAEQRRAELEAVIATHRKDDQARIERLQARVDEVERKYVFDTAELRRENEALRKQAVELEALKQQAARRGMKAYAKAIELGRRVAELEAGQRPTDEVLDDFIARCEVALSGCCSECDAAITIVKGRRQAALDNAPVPELSADKLTALLAPSQALREDETAGAGE